MNLTVPEHKEADTSIINASISTEYHILIEAVCTGKDSSKKEVRKEGSINNGRRKTILRLLLTFGSLGLQHLLGVAC